METMFRIRERVLSPNHCSINGISVQNRVNKYILRLEIRVKAIYVFFLN